MEEETMESNVIRILDSNGKEIPITHLSCTSEELINTVNRNKEESSKVDTLVEDVQEIRDILVEQEIMPEKTIEISTEE